MIKLIPLADKSELNKLCLKHHIVVEDSIFAYVSASPDVNASCVFSLDGTHVEILAMDFDERDILIPELLIRAVGAYAANRCGYLLRINRQLGSYIISTLQTMRFEEDEEGYFGKIPKLLQGSCCQHNE